MSKAEWKKYKIENDNRLEFDSVRHISHVSDAIRIIEDGVIRSSLIWDESRLRNSRTCISWVSPNWWASGSIYGNVSFEFDWDEIIEGCQFYWVEDVPQYRPPAYRILVTDKDYDPSKAIIRYDPTKKGGPIFSDGKAWYRNNKYTGEFMIDEDLYVRNCREVKFIDHHPNICKKHGSSCTDIEMHKYDAGANVLANLIGRRIYKAADLFLDRHINILKLTSDTKSMINRIYLSLTHDVEYGQRVSGRGNKDRLLRAALIYYGESKYDDALELAKLLGSKKDFKMCFLRILTDYFKLTPEFISKEIGFSR